MVEDNVGRNHKDSVQGMIKTVVFDFGNVIGFFDHRIASNRLAEHTGPVQNMLVKRMPCAAKRSTFGDFTSGSP